MGAAVYHLSTKKATAERDPDRDRLTNRREYRLRTNPRRSDTDRDGYGDAVEVRGGTDPRDPASHPGTGGGRAVTGRHGERRARPLDRRPDHLPGVRQLRDLARR